MRDRQQWRYIQASRSMVLPAIDESRKRGKIDTGISVSMEQVNIAGTFFKASHSLSVENGRTKEQ